jgi:uracil-DNA glycosylase
VRAAVRITCPGYPCGDVDHRCFAAPAPVEHPERIRMIAILESPPADPPGSGPSHAETTLQAFRSAGTDVLSMSDLGRLGVYVTTALKCAKTGYGVQRSTVESCSFLLEAEIGLFPNARVVMLMGDTAIAAMNAVARRNTGKQLVPARPTHRLRGKEYRFDGLRVFPSYLCTGRSYLIEASKREMIATDLRAGLAAAAR